MDMERAVKEIDDVLGQYGNARKRSLRDDLSDLPMEEQAELATLMGSALRRLSPVDGHYDESIRRHQESYWDKPHELNQFYPGLLRALRDDYAKGRLKGFVETVRGELYSDFLNIAGGLIEEGLVDAAAVIAGGVLEDHLRKMCVKRGIPIKDAKGVYRGIEAMNGDLAGAKAHTQTELKSITSWAGYRNDSAHGHFNKHSPRQVDLMVESIRDYIARHPA